MPQIYNKDKSLRITFRCEEKLGDWIRTQSEILGVSPSAFVRQNLFSMMAQQARLSAIMETTIISSAKAVVEHEHNLVNK